MPQYRQPYPSNEEYNAGLRLYYKGLQHRENKSKKENEAKII